MSKIHSYKGVDYSPKNVDGKLIELTDAECEVLLQQTTAWNNESANRKLTEIRKIRNQKLQETDYLGVSDNSMSSDWIAKRKSWRDIPQDYTTETKYDELLARDSDGKLTHTIWEKP
jgi:hypothetical protein